MDACVCVLLDIVVLYYVCLKLDPYTVYWKRVKFIILDMAAPSLLLLLSFSPTSAASSLGKYRF